MQDYLKFGWKQNYNFVFFDQVPDLEWDKSYLEFLPKVLKTKNTTEYYLVLQKFLFQLKDGHTGVWFPKQVMDKIWRSPDVKIRLIENKVIITDKGISLSNVDIGDEITQVEGIEVHKYAKTRKYLIETSTDHYGTYRTLC